MPEPQRIDFGGTEGEDSVSSVSFELISRLMGAKQSRFSDIQSSPENHQGSGAMTQLSPSQGPQYGAPFSKAEPPFQSLRGPSSVLLDLSLQVQVIWAN
ncbi:hypothetical protein O181_052092 [Austropuccinia psidii MF-1]|uniref:Uncharacterized protein n=1 Tax=Austropuccinia psidii MF-1 TaxID=1389203 RepID=A0A9Q3E282_9BASI|nr:hypothetical protein [Austropuccinia psidii MF-1]